MTTPLSHVLIMPCSVTGEPWKATRNLSKQIENTWVQAKVGSQACRLPWWGATDVLCWGALGEFLHGLSSLLFPRSIIPVRPFRKRRAPTPVAAGLGENRHVTKKTSFHFP